MTQKNKLKFLLESAIKEYKRYLLENDEPSYLVYHNFLTDYLIKNGVIVLPVKAGDRVYMISYNKVKECEVGFIGLSKHEELCHFTFAEDSEYGFELHSSCFDDIGKTVFLTKEEAERALAERREDE